MGPGRPFYLSFLALAQMLPRKVYFYSLYKSDKEVFSAPMSVAIKVSHFPEFFSFRTGTESRFLLETLTYAISPPLLLNEIYSGHGVRQDPLLFSHDGKERGKKRRKTVLFPFTLFLTPFFNGMYGKA